MKPLRIQLPAWHSLRGRLQIWTAILAAADLLLLGFLYSPWSPSRKHALRKREQIESRMSSLRRQVMEMQKLQATIRRDRQEAGQFVRGAMPDRERLYSTTLAALNRLAKDNQVELSDVHFHPRSRAGAGVREIGIAGGLNGAYPNLVRFLNAVERAPQFFLIRQIALAGRQSSSGNQTIRLQIALDTFQRLPIAGTAARKIQTTDNNTSEGFLP